MPPERNDGLRGEAEWKLSEWRLRGAAAEVDADDDEQGKDAANVHRVGIAEDAIEDAEDREARRGYDNT